MDVWDALLVVGTGLVAVGLWLWTPAVSLTVSGTLLIVYGLAGARGTSVDGSRDGH